MGRILVVRHGQASYGAADYDVLSPLGERQATIVGKALRDFLPDLVVSGDLKRQRRTAELAAAAAGWAAPRHEDPRWNEMDHLNILSRIDPPTGSSDGLSREEFQQWFVAATDRWRGGEHDGDYVESFGVFWDRVEAAITDLAEVGNVAVFTSGGPISVVAASLLRGGADTYARLAPVVVNASVTRVLTGAQGLTLLTFNEHEHFTSETGTYR